MRRKSHRSTFRLSNRWLWAERIHTSRRYSNRSLRTRPARSGSRCSCRQCTNSLPSRRCTVSCMHVRDAPPKPRLRLKKRGVKQTMRAFGGFDWAGGLVSLATLPGSRLRCSLRRSGGHSGSPVSHTPPPGGHVNPFLRCWVRDIEAVKVCVGDVSVLVRGWEVRSAGGRR
jgi:hypothetical protein